MIFIAINEISLGTSFDSFYKRFSLEAEGFYPNISTSEGINIAEQQMNELLMLSISQLSNSTAITDDLSYNLEYNCFSNDISTDIQNYILQYMIHFWNKKQLTKESNRLSTFNSKEVSREKNNISNGLAKIDYDSKELERTLSRKSLLKYTKGD